MECRHRLAALHLEITTTLPTSWRNGGGDFFYVVLLFFLTGVLLSDLVPYFALLNGDSATSRNGEKQNVLPKLEQLLEKRIFR